MNMDVWYDFLVRELADLNRAKELREDAEQSASAEDAEATPPQRPTTLFDAFHL